MAAAAFLIMEIRDTTEMGLGTVIITGVTTIPQITIIIIITIITITIITIWFVSMEHALAQILDNKYYSRTIFCGF